MNNNWFIKYCENHNIIKSKITYIKNKSCKHEFIDTDIPMYLTEREYTCKLCGKIKIV